MATGHDYRGDLAPFIRDIFDFKISNNEYNDILYALKANDKNEPKKSNNLNITTPCKYSWVACFD